MGVVQAIKLMRSSIPGQIPALPMAQVAVNLTDKILFVGVDGTTDNLIKFVDVGGVGSMMSAYLPKTGGTIGGDLTVEGDLIVSGTTVTANVSTMLVEDPIITLGGTSAPTETDPYDRGIEFHWFDSTASTAKKGFFGFDCSEQKFTFIPDAVIDNNKVISGDVGTILANIEGNASTATKVNKAVTFNKSGSGADSGASFDGSAARTISYNTIGAAALAGSASQDFSTKNLSVASKLDVNGQTTLAGGVGITSGALTLTANSTTKTPYIDFFYYNETEGYSRIIEEVSTELSIYAGTTTGYGKDGKIILKSDTYAEKALYIGGDSGAKLVFVAASGETPAYLKLQNYDGGVMHFVTTGGQTMYSAGVPSEGGGGGATVILNGATNDNPAFYAPTSSGSPGQYLISGGEDVAPSWITMPTATSLVAGIMKLGASGGAATYEHGHTFASLSSKPNTLAGYGINDAAPLTHVGAGAGAHAVVSTSVNGFMSATDKRKLDHLYPVIYNAGAAAGKTLADASGSIPDYLYNTRSMLLIFGDTNEQHVYLWIATTNIVAGNKDNPANWLRISKPDVDGGTY